MTNTSGHTCTVHGYGGLEMRADNGSTLKTELTREPKPAPELVTVKPGAKAYKKLQWVIFLGEEGDEAAEGCQDVEYLAVTLPDDTKTVDAHDPAAGSDGMGFVCSEISGYAWTAKDQGGEG